MKNTVVNTLLILACSASLMSCNKSDGYEKIVGLSAAQSGDIEKMVELEKNIFCKEALNIEACTALKESCTIVYGDSEDAEGNRPFEACIDNPNIPLPPNPPIDPIDVVDPVDPKDPIDPKDPVDPKDPIDPKDPADPVVDLPEEDENEEEIPVEEAAKGKCSDIDEKYLLRKGKGQPKVIICHSNPGSEVTISVACPALKAHTSHNYGKDILGACK